MKLNHLQVSTYDVDASAAFYERFFGFRKGWEADGETFLVREADEDGFSSPSSPSNKGQNLPSGCTLDSPWTPSRK